MLGAEGTADEPALVVNMHLGEVAGIVEHRDLLADEGCQGRLDVAAAQQADTVAQYLARLGDMYQQHVELVEAVGHRRQEAALLPTGNRRFAGAAVRALMVDAAHERLEAGAQFAQRKGRRRQRLAPDQVA